MKKSFITASFIVALMALPSLINVGTSSNHPISKSEIQNASTNSKSHSANENVEQLLWKNDGTLKDPNWSLTTYFFGTDCPDRDMYLATFPLSTWQKLKYNTIYLDFEPTGATSDVQIQICDFDASHIWKDVPLKIDSEFISLNPDGTYTLSMSFYGDPVCDLDELVITGCSFVPLKLYFYGDPTYQNLWANDGTHGTISWSGEYRFGQSIHGNDGDCIELFPEITFRKLRGKTFYLDFAENDFVMIKITTSWWTPIWYEENILISDEHITHNDDGTYTLTINFDGTEIQDYLDERDLLITGGGYTPLNIHYYLSEYTVSFNTMGHGEIAPIVLMEDSFIPKPADPVDDRGLHFLGWYQDPEFTKPWYFDDDTVYQDMTLYAKFAEDGVSSIEVSHFPYPVINSNASLKFAGAKIQINYFSGAKQEINLTESMIEDYRKNAKREQTITIKYDGKKTFQKVLVSDTLHNFLFKTGPIKTEFKYGEDLNLTGTKVVFVYSSAMKEFVFDLDPFLVSGYDKETLGKQTLTATYPIGTGFELTFNVTVIDYITGISIQPPDKLEYKYGEQLDLSGGVITKFMATGNVEDISITAEMVSGYDKNKPGEQTLTVTYEGFTKTFEVTVVDEITSITMKSNPAKSVIIKGQDLDLTDAKITTSYLSGKAEVIDITNEMVSGYNKEILGEQTITVTYETFTTTFKVTVIDEVVSITLKSAPTKTQYKYGEELDLDGSKITVVASSGEQIDADVTPSLVSGYNKNKLGEQTLTITYENMMVTFNVTVVDYVAGISLKSAPNCTTYFIGQQLDLSGAKIITSYASSKTEELDVTSSMVSGYDKNKIGEQTITVTYENFTVTFVVKVLNTLKPQGLSTAAIIGIVFGSVALASSIALNVVLIVKRKKTQ